MSSTQDLVQNLLGEIASFAGGLGDLVGRIGEALTSPDVLAALALCAVVAAADFVRRGFRVAWPRKVMIGAFATLAILAANVAFSPFVVMLAKGFNAAYAAIGAPRIDPAFWSGVPIWITVPLAILAFDVANYWNHRAMHLRWLWPVHAVHHSEQAVNGLTTLRVHGLEALVMTMSYTLLLSWLGFPPDVLGGVAAGLALFNAYQHVDVDWGHGPLRHVIASPRFHRWHHADVPEAHGKNLANVFPFLDVMFGTYYAPGRCDARLGAEGVPENDVPRLMLFPFVAWARMAGQALRVSGAKAAAEG